MTTIKKQVLLLVLVLLSFSMLACSAKEASDPEEISVGVAFYPMKEILQLIEEDLLEAGYSLSIHEFSDYQTPNALLRDKELDANMIQHDFFLQTFNAANGSDLLVVQPIYHATFALYARNYTSLAEIEEGSILALADDASNLSRSLYLLGQAGLLTFKEDKTIGLKLDDIQSNPKKLELDASVPLTSLAQRYEETGLAVMYPTYAKSLELEGDEERLFLEKEDEITEKYAISLVARSDNKEADKIQALTRALTSDKVRNFLIDDYGWASRPAF